MCYVHNQWYDISWATLYYVSQLSLIYAQDLYKCHITRIEHQLTF